MEGSFRRGAGASGQRRFAWSLSASGSAHAAVLGVATLFGGWVVAADSEAPAPARIQPITIAQAEFPELVEEELDVHEPAPDLEEAELVEETLVDEPESTTRPELTDPLAGAMWVTRKLAWRVEPTEPVVTEHEPAPEALPPVEPVPVEVEIALEDEPEVVEATVLAAPAPRYPRLSIRNAESGTVSCRLHVSAAGTVTLVEVVESSGHRRLDEAAVETLLTWRFVPRTEDGRAAATTILHPVTFVLEDD